MDDIRCPSFKPIPPASPGSVHPHNLLAFEPYPLWLFLAIVLTCHGKVTRRIWTESNPLLPFEQHTWTPVDQVSPHTSRQDIDVETGCLCSLEFSPSQHF
jgi:hypothetical protein